MNIFGELVEEWHDHVHHGHHAESQAPAPQPVNLTAAAAAAPAQEDPVSLTTLENDVRNDLTDGLAYVEGMVARLKAAAPGIIATADTVAGSTIGKLAEAAAGAILPQPAEEILVSLVKDFVARYGQPQAAPADPAASAAPAPAQ